MLSAVAVARVDLGPATLVTGDPPLVPVPGGRRIAVGPNMGYVRCHRGRDPLLRQDTLSIPFTSPEKEVAHAGEIVDGQI